MPLDDDQVDRIDQEFRQGSSIEDVFEGLRRAGHEPNEAFHDYSQRKLPTGKRRADINVKDPLEWTDHVRGDFSKSISDEQFAAVELSRQEGADLGDVHEALGAAGLDADAAVKEYLADPRRRTPARNEAASPDSPDGWE